MKNVEKLATNLFLVLRLTEKIKQHPKGPLPGCLAPWPGYCRSTTKKRIPNFLQNTKSVISGSPRGRFEHRGVETA